MCADPEKRSKRLPPPRPDAEPYSEPPDVPPHTIFPQRASPIQQSQYFPHPLEDAKSVEKQNPQASFSSNLLSFALGVIVTLVFTSENSLKMGIVCIVAVSYAGYLHIKALMEQPPQKVAKSRRASTCSTRSRRILPPLSSVSPSRCDSIDAVQLAKPYKVQRSPSPHRSSRISPRPAASRPEVLSGDALSLMD